MARAIFLAIVGLVLAWSSVAAADDRQRLRVEASAEARSCGTADVVRAKIAERLGRDPFRDDDAEASELRIAFGRSRRTWTADIALADAKGERIGGRSLSNDGTSCEGLVASVVFTVAVLLEDLAPRPSEPPPPPAAPIAPEPTPAPAEPERPRPAPPPVRTLRLDGALAGAAGAGLAPASIVGVEAIVGLDAARARLELSGRAWLPASTDDAVAVRTRLVYGRLAPCYGWLVASACAVVAVGSVSGEAIGDAVTGSKSEARLYAATGPALLSRFFFVEDVAFVRASVDLLFSLARAGFDVGERRVWTVPAVAVTGALGVGVRLP